MTTYALMSQEGEWGCGVACVASLLGLSYKVARQRLEKRKGRGIDVKPQGLDLEPIVTVLHRAGVEVVADWFARGFPSGTIAYIEGAAPYDCGHYLLRIDEGWMDPWFNMNMPKEDRVVRVRKGLPKGTKITVALIPK